MQKLLESVGLSNEHKIHTHPLARNYGENLGLFSTRFKSGKVSFYWKSEDFF
jgi:hypothetical protein